MADFYLCWEKLIASSSAHVCSAWQLLIFSAYGMAILGYLHSWLTCSVVDLSVYGMAILGYLHSWLTCSVVDLSVYGMAILGYLHSWLTCSVVDLQCVWHGYTGLSAQLAHLFSC